MLNNFVSFDFIFYQKISGNSLEVQGFTTSGAPDEICMMIIPCHLEIEAEVWGKLEQEIDTESWATSKDFRVVIFSLLGHIHSDDLVVMLELA